MASTIARLLSTPPVAVVSPSTKLVGASLKAKLTVAVGAATLTSLLLIETATVGVTVSTTIFVVEPPVPGLPLASDQLAPVTLTEPLLMSVPALAVKVAV